MSLSLLDLAPHLRHQGPVIAGMGQVALSALTPKLPRALRPKARPVPPLPGPKATQTVPPRDPQLVADYLRWSGADVRAWRGRVPHHLFPQWAFGLLPQTLAGLPYPLASGLNGGCSLVIHQDIPLDAPLQLSAWLHAVDDDGRRALITQRIETRLPDGSLAQEAALNVFIPLPRDKNTYTAPKPKAKRSPTLVPLSGHEIGSLRFSAEDGVRFALLTGDINPVHWLRPYGRAAGFGGTILHGFGTLARSLEILNRSLWAGDTRRLKGFTVRFTRPVRLPSRSLCFAQPDGDHGSFWVGAAPGAPAALQGQYFTRIEDAQLALEKSA